MLSIEKSREMLGDEYKHCTDEEIEKVRDGANMFPDIFIEGILNKKEAIENEKNESNEQCNN
jgi:hypothetical protein